MDAFCDDTMVVDTRLQMKCVRRVTASSMDAAINHPNEYSADANDASTVDGRKDPSKNERRTDKV